MRTVNYDALAASAPINADAALARDGGGNHWTANISATVPRWDTCPALKTLADLPAISQDTARGLFGRRVGRFTVIGIWVGSNPKKNATWVCRCDCGYFEGRKAKALLAAHNPDMACTECERVQALRRISNMPPAERARQAYRPTD